MGNLFPLFLYLLLEELTMLRAQKSNAHSYRILNNANEQIGSCIQNPYMMWILHIDGVTHDRDQFRNDLFERHNIKVVDSHNKAYA